MKILIIITCITWLAYFLNKVLRWVALATKSEDKYKMIPALLVVLIRLFYTEYILSEIQEELSKLYDYRLIVVCQDMFDNSEARKLAMLNGYQYTNMYYYDKLKYYKLLIDKYLVDSSIIDTFNNDEVNIVKNYFHF